MIIDTQARLRHSGLLKHPIHPPCLRRHRMTIWLLLCALLALSILQAGATQACDDGRCPDTPAFFSTPHYLVDQALRRYRGEWGQMQLQPASGKMAWRGVYLRLHATTANPGTPLFFVAGGPGISGIESMLETVPDLGALLAQGDVVVVDQRGAGLTRPQLDCPQTWGLPITRPVSREEMIEEARRKFAACRADWEAAGVELDVVHTRTHADDIVRVADHLGYDKIRLFGHSYGTQISLDFVHRHGRRVERVVIAGVMAPGDALRLPAAPDRVFADLAARIAADPATRAAYPDPVALARAAVARVRAEPLQVQVPGRDGQQVVLDDYALRWQAVQMLGRRADAVRLPLLLHRLARGERHDDIEALLDDMALQVWRDRQGPLSRRSTAAHYLTTCASGIAPERLAQIREQDRTTLFGFVLHVMLPEACDAWGIPALDDTYRAPIRTDVPILMVSGSLDIRTPMEQADALMPGFTRGVHLVIRQAGHGDLLRHAQVNAAIERFLAGASVTRGDYAMPWPEIPLP